jgi:carbamoyl-phosphate synthase small subunit
MPAILALESGHVFHGRSIGVNGIRVGEVVFNTAMTGYQEIISDPSYAQQLITFTYPHIGNTGINLEDFQASKIHAAGIIIKSLSNYVSSWRATMSLQAYLLQQNTVAIADIDTRGLTKLLRDNGSLHGCIMAGNVDIEQAIEQAKNFVGLKNLDLASTISTKDTYTIIKDGCLNIILVDFGVKDNIIQCLTNLGCNVTVVPAQTTCEEITDLKPDGILLSNGPGDPKACTEIIANIKQLIKTKIPIFGICLGHQLLALALGAKTYKMNFGHHGANQPVQNLSSKQVLITSQNHGFAVKESSLNTNLEVTHRALFDQSLQGFKHTQYPLYGFQGHPEAAPGPHDALSLFDDFIHAIRTNNATTK